MVGLTFYIFHIRDTNTVRYGHSTPAGLYRTEINTICCRLTTRTCQPKSVKVTLALHRHNGTYNQTYAMNLIPLTKYLQFFTGNCRMFFASVNLFENKRYLTKEPVIIVLHCRQR